MLMDNARRRVIGCHLNLETRVQNAFDDGASDRHQSIYHGIYLLIKYTNFDFALLTGLGGAG